MRHIALLAVPCLAVLPAAGAELPVRKEGLWEVKIGYEGRPMPQTVQQCTDAATDAMMQTPSGGTSKEVCSKRDVKTSGDTMTIDSVCTIDGRAVETHAVVTGSFDSAYKMTMTTKGSGPPQPGQMQPITMTLEGKWLGACKADQKPGDIVMPGGIKLNVRDMQNLLPGLEFPRRRF